MFTYSSSIVLKNLNPWFVALDIHLHDIYVLTDVMCFTSCIAHVEGLGMRYFICAVVSEYPVKLPVIVNVQFYQITYYILLEVLGTPCG